MLPTLSCLSVRHWPGHRLPLWYSSRSLHISLFHREFYVPLQPSSLPISRPPSQLSREISPVMWQAACTRFTPSNSGQRLPPTYYRGCWHVVSRGFFLGYCHYPPPEKEFTPRRASSSTRRRSVRLAPIAEDSSLLPPVGVWAVLNPSVADHPLRPATDHRLGALLPHLLA